MAIRCTSATGSASNVTKVYCTDDAKDGIAVKLLTKIGTIRARSSHAMIGDATSGTIFGGWIGSVSEDLVTYTATQTQVTYSTLAKTGDTLPALTRSAMVGTPTDFLIFGGWNTNHMNGFYRCTVSSGTATISSLTISGIIPALSDAVMIGSVTAGIIFGGHNSAGRQGNFYSYTVSGDTVTVALLTLSGTIPPRTRFGMLGTTTAGVIFCGQGNNNVLYNTFYSYTISASTATVSQLTINGTISARQGLGAVGSATDFVIFGGEDSANSLNDFHRCTVDSGTVSVTELPKDGSIHEVNTFGMVGTIDDFAIFGGWTGSVSDNFYRGGLAYYPKSISRIYCTGDNQTLADWYSVTETGPGDATANFPPRYGLWGWGSTPNGLATNGRYVYSYSITGTTARSFALTRTRITPDRLYPAVAGAGTAGLMFGGADTLADGRWSTNTFRTFTASAASTPLSITVSGVTAGSAAETTALEALKRSNAGIVGDSTSGVIYGGVYVRSDNGIVVSVRNDFWRYTISGGAATVKQLTGTVSARYAMGMVGTSTAALIFGGATSVATRSSGLPFSRSNAGINFNAGVTFSSDFYRITISGDNVTSTLLTKTGDSITARAGMAMKGSDTSGLIWSGTGSAGTSTRLTDLFSYEVDTSANTVEIKNIPLGNFNQPGSLFPVLLGSPSDGYLFDGDYRATYGGDISRLIVNDRPIPHQISI